MADLVFRPMTPDDADLERFSACFEANGSPRDDRQLRWQYREPPVGRLYAEFAEEPGGKVGGIYAVFPARFRVRGKVYVGVQSLNTLTDEAHRGKGLFTKLAKRVYDRCQAEDVALVYGFPNGSSAHGFFERLGWARLDPVPFLVRPLRLRKARLPEALVKWVPDVWPRPLPRVRLTANEEVAVATAVDASLAAVWASFAVGVNAAVERDLDYLKWRLARPKAGYKVLVFRRGGEVRGWVAFTVQEKHGGRIGYVMELLHAPGDDAAGAALAAAALRDLSALGAEVVLAWCFDHSANRGAYGAVGFRPLPPAVWPIELHFGVRALAAPADAALGNRENWYLSYLDSDTV
jgi:GNAT superfamily N-acetyltransferase